MADNLCTVDKFHAPDRSSLVTINAKYYYSIADKFTWLYFVAVILL